MGSYIEKIPIIDVSPISLKKATPSTENYEKVAKSLCEALSTWGFAYLANHGIEQNDINSCFENSHDFFELPQKMKDSFA